AATTLSFPVASRAPPQPAVASSAITTRKRRDITRDRSTSLRTGIIICMWTSWIEDAWTRLRGASGRSGGARRAVVEYIGGQDCCVSAQEIHDGLRSGRGRVGIASVYRTLEGLDELGLVQRIDLGDGVSRFEPAHSGGEHHHHL